MTAPAALVLAAGSSSRLGSPKQLARFAGSTLLRHAAQTALASGCRPVVIVLGANAAALEPELAGLAVQMVVNADWREGMASSIRAGLNALPGAEAVLITLCDQPAVTADHLAALLDLYGQSGQPIAASRYGGSAGVPAIFARSLFHELTGLQGDTGARRILARHAAESAFLELPEAAIDIDTPADLARLIR